MVVSDLPAYTWESCGQRIRTLEFYMCRGDVHTVKQIIFHCGNLTSFVIESSYWELDEHDDLCKILYSPLLLDGLIEEDIRLTKLHTFTILDEDKSLSESVLKKIFLLCPRLKHFGVGAASFQAASMYEELLNGEELPEYSRRAGCLNSVTRLHSLTFNFPTNGEWIKTLIASDEQEFRFVRGFRCNSTSRLTLLSFHIFIFTG